MEDLIRRQAAINTVQTMYERCDTGDMTDYRDLMYESIIVLPSVQERRGRWIHDGYDFPGGVDWIHCSECGKRGINVPADLSNYCPNCGAHMDEVE